MRTILQLTFLLLSFSLAPLAQKEHNVWYFGTGAGITFNSGTPVSLAGGQTNCYEGIASICDNAGNLLFYTDGVSVWDKTNGQMPNGNGLLGENSSTESAIILQKPGSQNLYYIFTAPVVGLPNPAHPAAYSIVDMTLNGGNGDVTSAKNITLLAPATERLTYARHANGTDYWVIYHKWNSSDYYAYLLSATGLNLTPVVSTTGLFISNSATFNDIGYLKSSPCGNHLALANEGLKTIELLDFNQSTGVVSNGYTLSTLTEQFATYGTEFSPGGQFSVLLNQLPGHVYQFNLKAGSLSAIAASKILVGSSAEKCGAMQTGPDGKIYITQQGGQFLCAVNNPDLAGNACNFVDNAVACIGGVFGLPNFVAEQYCGAVVNKPKARFSSVDTIICAGNCSAFKNTSLYATSYKWSFPGGNPSTSTDSVPTTCYATSDEYDVQLIAINSHGSDTLLLTQYIRVNPLPHAGTVTSSRDNICQGSGFSVLNVAGSSGNIQWQSSIGGNNFMDILSANANSYTTPADLLQTTSYRVKASNSCGTDSSNIVTVHILPSPVGNFSYSSNGRQVTFSSAGSSSDVTEYSWDFGDNILSTDPKPTHIYSHAGVFNVCLTVNNGSNCSYKICQHIDLLDNGVAQLHVPILLYPNPIAGKQLIVTLDDAETIANAQINVVDVLGRKLSTTISAGKQTILDVGDLSGGTYFLSIQTEDNVMVRKFVKQ